MPEYIDLYDKDKIPLSKTIKRGDEIKKNEYYKVVLGIIINHDNEILLTKRSQSKAIAPGLWECTAGAVISGETSKDAIKREVREEVGIKLDDGNIHYVKTFIESKGIFDVWISFVDFNLSDLLIDFNEVDKAITIKISELHNFVKNQDVTKSLYHVLDIVELNHLSSFVKRKN